MESVLLVIHLLIALALVGVILIQRSEGGGLGIGGGNMGGMMSPRGTANPGPGPPGSRGACFMATSGGRGVLGGAQRAPTSISDTRPAQPVAPAAPAQPATPAQPAPPVAQ
ncbi:preprotein translocase subunit SecG [Azospirillum brasilense]|nr:preprotein translocase subunit SecG [Azospirillum brasilense]